MKDTKELTHLEDVVLKEIYLFANRRRWEYGINQNYILNNLNHTKYTRREIEDAIQSLNDKGIIYSHKNYGNTYWLIVIAWRNYPALKFNLK